MPRAVRQRSVPLKPRATSELPRRWAEDLEPKLGLAGRKKVLQAQAVGRQLAKACFAPHRPAERGYLQPDGSWGPFHTAQLPRSWRQAAEKQPIGS
ncbi:unnamed protein product [Effrenium voratum]|nr:unnamed protein product [Effrenium voratum]